MRSKKGLIYLDIKDLTQEEIEHLADFELNACDNCGRIELSEKLHWLESEHFRDDILACRLLRQSVIAICEACWRYRTQQYVDNPINVLKDILDWYNEAPTDEMDKVEDAIRQRFSYSNLVETIAHKEGKTFEQVEKESQERLKKAVTKIPDKVKALKFKCPKCGHTMLECVEVDAVVKLGITAINDSGDFDYVSRPTICRGEVDSFQCAYCGHVLTDDNNMDFLTEPEEIIEWCKKNCEQEDAQ
jgi:predicted RNA-binding Zn-ribbon protein involved in translation (DUF1610 family)